MKLYVGITDGDWHRQLAATLDLEEVNFWQPSGGPHFKALPAGGLFLFKLHAPRHFIVGGGVFLASILPYTNAEWEKLSIFLNFLVPKLPAPVDEDLAEGILALIDMDSFRVEKQAAMRIQLPDEDAQIEPVPTTGGGRMPEPELDRLSNIIKTFNDQFGSIPWTDADRVHKLITEEIPMRVASDTAYVNAKKNSDKQNARIEHDKALGRVMTVLLKDDTELFKQFSDNGSFRRWLTDTIFALTYRDDAA